MKNIVPEQLAMEPRERLKDIVSRNGEGILQDTDRCEGLLKDHCGMHRREIAALVGALEERVPLELKSSWQAAMTPEAMRSRLVQRMQDNRGLTPDLADWAVDTWSYALGIGLGRRSDRIASVVVNPQPKPGPAAVVNPIVNPLLAADLGNAAFARPAQNSQSAPADTSTPDVPATSTAPWSSQKKAVAAVAAAAVLYFGMTHMHQPTPAPDTTCPTGQTQAAEGGCVAIAGQSKGQGKGQPKGQPKVAPVIEAKQPKDSGTKTAALAAGTTIPVTVNEELNSDMVTVGQYVRGTVNAPVMFDGKTMVPAGTRVVLQVRGVDQSGKVLGAAKIDLALVEMTIGGKKHAVAGQAVVKGPSTTVKTVKDAGIMGGIGTGIGCGIGKLTRHTGAGCAAGATGGVGTGVLVSAHSKPKPAVLEPGKVVSFKLGQSVNLA